MEVVNKLIHHTLVFYIRDKEEPLSWMVSAEEVAQVTNTLVHLDRGGFYDRMLMLHTVENRTVLINLDHVVLAQSLVDYGIPIRKMKTSNEYGEADEDFVSDGLLMIDGLPGPIEFIEVAYSDLSKLASFLMDDLDTEFIPFIDDDGEYNFVKRDLVIYMEYGTRDEGRQVKGSANSEPDPK